MSPFDKSDVKNHLSTHDRNGRRLQAVPTMADATGFSSEESGNDEAAHPTGALLKPAEAPVLVPATPQREQA